MMRGLVVFESMFGNTQVIARSVADGLAPRMQVDLMEVGVAPAALSATWTCWWLEDPPTRSG